MIRPGVLGAVFLVFAGAVLPAAAEAGIPLITVDPAGPAESTARGISFYVDRGCSASISGAAYAMAKGSFTGGYYDYFSGGADLFASSYSPLCASAGFSPGFTFADYVQIRDALADGRVLVSRDTGRTPESLATVTSVSALSVEDAPEQQ